MTVQTITEWLLSHSLNPHSLMITKQDAIDKIKTLVKEVAHENSHVKIGETPRDGGGRIETWDIPVWTTLEPLDENQEDHVREATQQIKVAFDGNNTEIWSALGGSVQKNYVEPVAEVSEKTIAFNHMVTTFGANNLTWVRPDVMGGLDIGIFDVTGVGRLAVTVLPGANTATVLPAV